MTTAQHPVRAALGSANEQLQWMSAELKGFSDLVARLAAIIHSVAAATLCALGWTASMPPTSHTLADVLAAPLARLGRPVIRASIDGFHNPGAIRYARGKFSPEGYYFDSFDYV